MKQIEAFEICQFGNELDEKVYTALPLLFCPRAVEPWSVVWEIEVSQGLSDIGAKNLINDYLTNIFVSSWNIT